MELTIKECKDLAGFVDLMVKYLDFCEANGMDHNFSDDSITSLHRFNQRLSSLVEQSNEVL